MLILPVVLNNFHTLEFFACTSTHILLDFSLTFSTAEFNIIFKVPAVCCLPDYHCLEWVESFLSLFPWVTFALLPWYLVLIFLRVQLGFVVVVVELLNAASGSD